MSFVGGKMAPAYYRGKIIHMVRTAGAAELS